MALHCNPLSAENPWLKQAIFHEMTPEQNRPAEQGDKMAQRNEAKEKIDTARLIPESVKKLNEILAKTPENKVDIFLATLDGAISEASAIERMASSRNLSPEILRALWANFTERYKDFEMSPEDIQELKLARLDVQERLTLMETRIEPNTTVLSQQALSFLKDGAAYLRPGNSLDLNKPYKADFKNPSTGKVNSFFQQNLTWGHVMKAAGLTKAEVIKSNGQKVTTYLSTDGRTYDKPDGTSPRKYVELLQDYTLIPLEKAAAPATQPESKPAEANLNAGISAVTGRPTPSEHASMAPKGAPGYRQSWEEEMETPIAEITAEKKSYNELASKTITLPEHFRDEDSYEQIRKMKYLDYGQKVYDAISKMANSRTEKGIPTSNREMWEAICGGVLSNGGRYEISFNEIVRAYFKEDAPALKDAGQWILEEYKTPNKISQEESQAFLEAVADLQTYLPLTAETEVTDEEYRDLRREKVREEMKQSSEYTDEYFFKKDSYGPPVRLSVFQGAIYALKGKDRPVITADNWTDEAAIFRKEGEALNYGEMELISNARAYDKLMETNDPQKFVDAMNRYRSMGEAQIKVLAELAKLRGFKLKGIDTSKEFTTEEFTLNGDKIEPSRPSKEQIQAVHYGMMLEAAQELKLYQEAEETLTQEQKDELTYTSTGDIHLVGGVAGSVDVPGFDNPGVTGLVGVKGKVAPGTSLDVGLMGSRYKNGTRELGPTGGISWESRRMGKRDRFRFGAGAHVSKDWRSGEVGVNADVYGKQDLNDSGTWALKAMVDGGLGFSKKKKAAEAYVGGSIGAEKDLSRVIEKRVEDFEKEHAEDINNAKTATRAKLDEFAVAQAAKGQPVDPASLETLKQSSDAYIDAIIREGVINDYTKLLKQIKFMGGGVGINVGFRKKDGKWSKPGFRPDIEITFASVGLIPMTIYAKPPMESGTLTSAEDRTEGEWTTEGKPVEVGVEIPDAVLWMGDAKEEEAAKTKAMEGLTKAYDARNEALKDYVTFTPGDTFTEIDFKGLNGTVRLYMDPGAKMELIQNPDSVELNANITTDFNLQIREIGSGQGGDNVVEVYLSDKMDRTPEQIKGDSNAFVTWNQTVDGSTGPHSITRLNNQEATKNIYTATEANAAINSGTLTLRSMSIEGTKGMVREIKRDELARHNAALESTLFDEYSQEDITLAKTVGESLKTRGFDYDDLALGGKDTEIDAEIQKIYFEEYDKDPSTATTKKAAFNVDHIYMARQYAMEQDRPSNLEMPLKWNAEAFEKIAGEASKLYSNYLTTKKTAIENGSLADAGPEGSEFRISISHDGEKAVLGGYYSQALHGEMNAKIDWNDSDPSKIDETLTALGAPLTEENREGVKKVAGAIRALDWKETPYNSLPDPVFSKAIYTVAGELLLSNRIGLYGAEDGQLLYEMAMNRRAPTNPKEETMQNDFVKNVQELLKSGETMVNGRPAIVESQVYSALYDKCMNLLLGKTLSLKYDTPTERPIQVKAKRERQETGLSPQQMVKSTNVTIHLGLPEISNEIIPPPPPTPAETGAGNQVVIPEIDPRIRVGEIMPGEHDEGSAHTF